METSMALGKTEVTTVADFILASFGPMSHLKLQKLLYYCQAYHLGYFKEPLFDDDFQAWMHGPVCRRVYDQMKGESILYGDVRFSGNYIPSEIIHHDLTSSQLELINDVLSELSTWTGLELEAATHRESPWIEARRGYGVADRCDKVISKASMMEFFASELNDQIS